MTFVMLGQLVCQDVDVVADVFGVDVVFLVVVSSILVVVDFALGRVFLAILLRVFVIRFYGRLDQLTTAVNENVICILRQVNHGENGTFLWVKGEGVIFAIRSTHSEFRIQDDNLLRTHADHNPFSVFAIMTTLHNREKQLRRVVLQLQD